MARLLPRVFLVRHGETEWSLNGRHTGRSDIPLTSRGEAQIKSQAPVLVGEGRLIDPKNICTAFISPRIRAQKTFHLLFAHLPEFPNHVTTDEVREWDYGEYEGLLREEILERSPGWTVWKDGCPGGESAVEMQGRVDRIIEKIRAHHREWLEEGKGNRDVVVVSHGHFSRCFIARWNRFDLKFGSQFNVEAGGIVVLSYNHHSLEEPVLSALNLNAPPE